MTDRYDSMLEFNEVMETIEVVRRKIEDSMRLPSHMLTPSLPMRLIEDPGTVPRVRTRKMSFETDKEHAARQADIDAILGVLHVVPPNTAFMFGHNVLVNPQSAVLLKDIGP